MESQCRLNTAIGDTEEETPTIEEVKCRHRGARASFWENKICNMETESETVDHRREIAHKQKMEEEILRFRRPWREVMRAVGVTDEVVQTSGQQPSETSDSSSDEEKSLSDCSSSSDEEYYARIEEQKRQARLRKELSDDEMDETIVTELENLDIRDFPKKPDDSKKSFQEQVFSESSDDEEYYARIEEQKRQARLRKELSDDEMDETTVTELENLDIRDFPKKPDDSKKSFQEQALSESSDDEEYYARIEEQKRQAKLKKELSDDEMDETIATELENLDIRDFPKKPDDSKKSDDAEKRNNSQSCVTVTEKKPAPQKSEEVAEHTTRVEIYKVTEKSPAEVLPGTDQYTPEQSADIDEETPCDVPKIMEQKSDAEQSPEIAEPKVPVKDTQATTKMFSPEQSADTDEQNTTAEIIKATEKKPALVQSEEITGQKIPAEVLKAKEKKLTPGLSAEIAEQRTSVEVLQTTERNSALLKSSEMAERKTLAEVPKASAKQSAPEQSADKVEQKVPVEVTQVTAKKSASEQFTEITEQETPIEVSKATEKSASVQYVNILEKRILAKVPHSTEKKSAPLKSAETSEQKRPTEVPQGTEKSVSEQSAYKTEQKTPDEVPKSTDKIHASVQSTKIAGPKTLAEVIAEVSQAKEKNPAPLQFAKIAEPKAPTELTEAMEKNSSPEQKETLFQVPNVTEKQSAAEQYAVIPAQKSTTKIFCATTSEAYPEKIANSVNQKITVETDRIRSMDSVDAVEEQSQLNFPSVSDRKVWFMKATDAFKQSAPTVLNATERKSGSKKYRNALEQKNALKDPSFSQRKPDSVNPEEYSTLLEVSNLEDRESRISNSSGNNTEVKDSETVPSVSKCPAVVNDSFAQSKSDQIQTVIDGTREDGNLGNGVGTIAELVNLTNKENEAHGHPTESSTWEDCDNVELDISVAQSDAPNSRSEHTASVEIDTGDLKAGGLNCIIQEELQKEVITHSESISQVCYTQSEEDIEVFYDAVSAVEGKDTHNQEKVELGEKHLAILAKTHHQENFQNEEVTEVSRWKRVLKKVGLAAIVTSCAVGGLYLLCKQADSDTFKCLWNTMSKVLPFVEPIPEPVPEKSFLWKLFDYFMPPPPPPPPERYILWELLDNLPPLFSR